MTSPSREQLHLTLIDAEMTLRKSAHLYALIIPADHREQTHLNAEVKALTILVDTVGGMITRTAQYIATTSAPSTTQLESR